MLRQRKLLTRKSVLKQRKPMKVRATPRRNDGRIAHGRVKPRAGKSAEEARHHARIAAMPCLACGSPATVHHVTSDGYKRIARSHRRVVPLCPRHHQIQHGPRESVEALGHAGFRITYGIDLLATADRLWSERP
jgi:hypothetical protein